MLLLAAKKPFDSIEVGNLKFVICVIDTESGTGNAEEMAAINEFNDELRSKSQLVLAEGIQSPSKSILIDNRAGMGLFQDGPLHQLVEYVSGFWIVEIQSLQEAREIAAQASLACNRRVELRPLF